MRKSTRLAALRSRNHGATSIARPDAQMRICEPPPPSTAASLLLRSLTAAKPRPSHPAHETTHETAREGSRRPARRTPRTRSFAKNRHLDFGISSDTLTCEMVFVMCDRVDDLSGGGGGVDMDWYVGGSGRVATGCGCLSGPDQRGWEQQRSGRKFYHRPTGSRLGCGFA